MEKLVLDKALVAGENKCARDYFKLRSAQIAQEKAFSPVKEALYKRARSAFRKLLREYESKPGALLDALLPEKGDWLQNAEFQRVSPDTDLYNVLIAPQMQDWLVSQALARVLEDVELPPERAYRKDAEFMVYSVLDDAYFEYGFSAQFAALLWRQLMEEAMAARGLTPRRPDEEQG